MGGKMTPEDETTDESRSYDRRLILKAAVATGVGAAAWAGPQIGRLGSAPAYALHCTQPVVVADFAGESINNGAGAGQCGPQAEINAVINGTINGITAVANGKCLNLVDGVTVTFASGGFCKISLIVVKNNGTPACNPTPVSSDVFPSGSLIPFPSVLDGQCPAGTATVRVQCSRSKKCLV